VSFRSRLLLAFAGVVVLPLVVLLAGVRNEVGERLSSQYSERVNALASVIEGDLTDQAGLLSDQLRALALDLGSDNRFRLALRTSADRRYLLDYAGAAMRRGGLAMLLIQDSTGRILSSGHFRNEYDRVAPPLGRLLSYAPQATAFARVRVPDSSLVVLARGDSLEIGGDRLMIVGGLAVSSVIPHQLSLNQDLKITLELPGDTAASGADAGVVAGFDVPFIDAVSAGGARCEARGAEDCSSLAPRTSNLGPLARIVVTQSLAPLTSLRSSVDRWFLVAGLLTVMLALAVAVGMASYISRPLQDLAEKTARVDLDRLDVEFEGDGEGEIGSLARLLKEMTERLRAGMARLREAERRATVGDLARQLNHDIKNGLVPVRNVFRHLAQVARDDPAALPAVLLERQGTIEAGISYLENLARNYARLSPALDRQPCDLNAVISELVPGLAGTAEVRLELGSIPHVAADPLVIRRIVENLVSNAVESLEGQAGQVTVSTSNGALGTVGVVRLVVADQGRGMTKAELDRAFEDFYTTKPGGTGLGLSIVRRLVVDLNGTLRVETAPGSGTRFVIDLPTEAGGPPVRRSAENT
jgi:signal transduction histidine kinase